MMCRGGGGMEVGAGMQEPGIVPSGRGVMPGVEEERGEGVEVECGRAAMGTGGRRSCLETGRSHGSDHPGRAQ